MAIATIDLDPSYITHQRRFALIPPDCCSTLSAEDERSVRIRTGDVIPTNSFSQAQVSVQQQKHDAEQYLAKTSANENDCRGTKRKASTTAEGYHAAVILDQEENASASLETGDDRQEQKEVDLESKGRG
jgi:hypothetical protein